MKFKQYSLVLMLLIACAAESEGRVIYVNNSQAVSGDGSIALPFKSIQEAVTAGTSGDTIMLMAGIYRERVIVNKSGLSFMPYHEEEVTLSGAEPLLNWELVEGSIYKTIMNWNVTEGGQSNQVFIDGQMIYEARWPKMTGNDMTYMPDNAKAKEVKQNVLLGNLNYRDFYFDAFNETAGRWDGAQVWVNLSHNGYDGQGWTGTVVKTDPVKHIITIDGRGLKIGENPWGLGQNTEFYLFSPKASPVYSSGGVAGILGQGEWWKNGDTLFVNTPNGLPPANEVTKTNLIEAKKRIYAFSPDPLFITMAATKITRLKFFATSVTTDINAANRADYAADARDNVIDSVEAKYITHFTDQRGDYQKQWAAKSGFIISGYNNTVKNSTFTYSSASAISIVGKQNKIWNNTIHDVNYSVSESGSINTGQNGSQCSDTEIAYNTIYNIPEQAIDIQQFRNSDPNKPGVARVHHNKISGFMIRNHDSGGLDGYGVDVGWVRYDHNIFSNATNFLAIGIYVDFGGRHIIDHNLFWNIDRPIQTNQNASVGYYPMRIYNNTAFADVLTKPGILNGVDAWGPSFDVRNNIMSGSTGSAAAGAIIRSNLFILDPSAQTELFTNLASNDYTLKSPGAKAIDKGEYVPYAYPATGTPDLGCFEFGVEPWKAGAGNFKPEFVLADTVQNLGYQSGQIKTWKFPVHAIAYCGFTGDISLSLDSLPSGITASLSSNTIAVNGTIELTIIANEVFKAIEPITLRGVSGNYSYSRTYAVTVPQIITGIEISPKITEAKLGDIFQFSAVAFEQFGSSMNPQPFISWAISGGGTISFGKFKATVLSEKVLITASSQGITDTLQLKVVASSGSIGNSETGINKLYPNPATDQIRLAVYSTVNQKTSLAVYNSLSKVCINKQWMLEPGENDQLIDISGLPKGLYLVKVTSMNGKNLGTYKIIKE